MGLRISTNIAAVNGQRNMSGTQANMANSLAQLSSGSRINKSADDAAGLAISESFRGYIRSARQANRNANDGISMIQTAEGGLNEIGNIIVRLRELGIQAASDTIGDRERSYIDKEVQQLKAELQRISDSTTWGSTKLLDGSADNFDFQVGIFNSDSADRITFHAGENVATLDSLGLSDVDFSNKEGAQSALARFDEAQNRVNDQRSTLGALQNRLVSTSNNLGIYEENLSAANSRIRDTDVAASTSELARNNILLQMNTASLAQANQIPSLALQLLG